MEAYTDIVTTYLKNNDIAFAHQGVAHPVFILMETGTENIYCLFDFAQGAVMYWSLLSWPVPDQSKDNVMLELDKLNKTLSRGMFEIDDQTGCVSFSNFYLDALHTAADKASLEDFCRDALRTMPRYYPMIRDVAFGTQKHINVVV